jgi:hypothetical protein
MFKRYSVVEVRGVKRVNVFCRKCGFIHDASIDCKLESVKVLEPGEIKIRRNGIKDDEVEGE